MRALIAALVLVAAPALAQDRMSQDQCTQSLAAIAALADLPAAPPAVQVDDEGWCALADIALPFSPQNDLRLAALRWRASDVERLTNDGLPPRSFEIEGAGFGVTVETGDPVLDYLLGVQMAQSQMNFALSARWDGVQNAVIIDNSHFEFDDTNRIDLTARIDDINLTDMGSIQTSAGTAGLRDLTIKSQFDGWFEAYALLVIGVALLDSDGQEPETQVAALKLQAIEFINQMPDDFMPDASRTALGAFINSMPIPRGTAQLQLSANPTLGAMRAGRFAALSPSTKTAEFVQSGLDGITMLFTWTPTEGTP